MNTMQRSKLMQGYNMAITATTVVNKVIVHFIGINKTVAVTQTKWEQYKATLRNKSINVLDLTIPA